jgi:hypothetical protein
MIRVHRGHGVIAGLDPAIQGCSHRDCCPWMPGSRPGMTWDKVVPEIEP